MKLIETQTATIDFDQDGDAYFIANGVANYLNEFMKADGSEFDGVTHITNTSGMGIKLNESNEEVNYTVFTI